MNQNRDERPSSDKKQSRNKSILKNGGSGNKQSNGSSRSSGGSRSSRQHSDQHSSEGHRKKGSKSRSASDIYDTPRVSSSVKWREDLTAAYEMTMAGRYNRRGSSIEAGKYVDLTARHHLLTGFQHRLIDPL